MFDRPDPENRPHIRLFHLLPNLLTIAAICAGLTAIRLGFEGRFETAVLLVLAACVLDGLDGRLARLMNSSTDMGAELDSLADFANFGVAPVLILYAWGFQGDPGAGWIAALFYATCCVLRLARFNVSSRAAADKGPSDYFVGIPSPAGAILVMLPMVASFAIPDLPDLPGAVITGHIFLVGSLMVSRLPTYSFKNMAIRRSYAKYVLLAAPILVAALLTYLWTVLTLLSLAYIGGMIHAVVTKSRSK